MNLPCSQPVGLAFFCQITRPRPGWHRFWSPVQAEMVAFPLGHCRLSSRLCYSSQPSAQPSAMMGKGIEDRALVNGCAVEQNGLYQKPPIPTNYQRYSNSRSRSPPLLGSKKVVKSYFHFF